MSSAQYLNQNDAQRAFIVGGYTPADPNDPKIVEMGEFSITEHNKEANAKLKFTAVIKAETQVVSGVNYRMTISAHESKFDEIKTYRVIVYSKPWQHVLRLTSFEEQVQDHPLLGGWKKIDNVNDPEVVEIGKYAVEEHNKETAGSSELEYVAIIKGEAQVVAGMNYKLVINAKECMTGKSKNYLAGVYTRVWENIIQLESFEEYQD